MRSLRAEVHLIRLIRRCVEVAGGGKLGTPNPSLLSEAHVAVPVDPELDTIVLKAMAKHPAGFGGGGGDF